jgi:hypothetical protein
MLQETDMRSAIRTIRQQRQLASCNGKAQAFKTAYDEARLKRLLNRPAPAIASTPPTKLPPPLLSTLTTKKSMMPSFKQAYDQARMRKQVLALQRAQKSNRPTPLISSASPTKFPSPLALEMTTSLSIGFW